MVRAVLISVVSVFLMSCSNQDRTGTEVPNIAGKLINSDSLNLRDLSKGKFTLINVWGIFCIPCMKELPILHKVYQKYKTNKNLKFITLAMDSESELLRFLNSKDSSDPYKKMFVYSKLDSFYLPTLACLPHGYSSYYYGGYAIVEDSAECYAIQRMIKSRFVPTTLIYNPTGQLVFKQVGSFENERSLIRTIDSLLLHQ